MTARNLLTIIFLAISVLSAGLLTLTTLNYTEFFKALEKIDLKLSDVDLVTDGQNVNVTIAFSIWNPTSYADFRVRELSYALDLRANDEIVTLSTDTLPYVQEPIPVEPYHNHTFEHRVSLDLNQPETSRSIELYESNQGDVTWTLNLTLILLTFTGPIDLPLSASKH